jgi:hypothetical protein
MLRKIDGVRPPNCYFSRTDPFRTDPFIWQTGSSEGQKNAKIENFVDWCEWREWEVRLFSLVGEINRA